MGSRGCDFGRLGFVQAGEANAQQPEDQPPVDQQAPPDAQQQQPPPGAPQPGLPPQAQASQADSDQGAGRVSFIHGDVSMQRGDTGEVSGVTLNTPLMAGDKISTGDGSRTEVQMDFANVLRLDQNDQTNVVTLNRSHIQLQLAQGAGNEALWRVIEIAP